ncbi:MAG: hypothetical protein PWR27_1889 [Petroclostridium sp.]|jgi:gas vesicle protein|uniref:YtxH domain-containing protein n=1 Tax=Petroclostridium xylanilyticum TaxID=1792311 RepID=UPI000E3C8577|nr:YtxH domain-containing protein [Petroclostridium xylanilyticum]MBZ4645552.1 hypothetical protein [Clostridia bacterium]MDK2811180.1 hypothetical protein [Petroclostridium sp.]
MRRNNFTRGLITGTIIGATLSMMVNPMDRRDKKIMRRKTNNFMRTVGDIIEDIIDMRG